MKKYISEIVKEVIDNYKDKQIEIADGLKWSQFQTIKRINYYKNNKYLERSDNAIFWNLVSPRVPHFVKNIDLDTKDLYPYGEGKTNFFQTFILKLRLKKWFKDNRFAIVLNDLAEDLADYGSAVWKKVKSKEDFNMEAVDLTRIYFDPTANRIKDANIVELHSLSETELRKRKDAWDNVEDVIDKMVEKGKNEKEFNEAEIWEYWGEYEDDNGDVKYGHYIGYGWGQDEILLYEEEDINSKKCPYRDFHIGRYNGRWLRIGCYERCFEIQERANKLVNQNEKTQDIASLLLLKSKGAETIGNVLTDLESGDIIPQDLEQIGIDNRAFGNFVNELQMIENQADKLCNTPEVITGEAMPSGTTFRGQATSVNAAKSAFRQIKERVGEEVGYILVNDVLSGIAKKWEGEVFELTDDMEDIKQYDEALTTKMRDDIISKGMKLTPDNWEKIQEQIIKKIDKVGRKIKIPKNFFDFDYGIRMNVTGEAENKQQKNDAYFNALSMVQANPAITDIPLFRQYCEDNSIKWWKLTAEQKEEMVQTAQDMGGRQGGQPMGGKGDRLMEQVDTE